MNKSFSRTRQVWRSNGASLQRFTVCSDFKSTHEEELLMNLIWFAAAAVFLAVHHSCSCILHWGISGTNKIYILNAATVKIQRSICIHACRNASSAAVAAESWVSGLKEEKQYSFPSDAAANMSALLSPCCWFLWHETKCNYSPAGLLYLLHICPNVRPE